ncbi:hypothetical protein EJ04DRAFT_548941 [Polyplosphaeria fusca]|uniref:Uncharacterized protein n=1 Tax=Polyplosphaeria fusca TaxID=682080 RepID=A0A9P4V7U6_9PLEO|nr:hypothetical protein EJ04DRAFT_548941 [Polyplosphaeria fusca]
MGKGSGCGRFLLATFRALQLLLSIATLACGIYNSAKAIRTALEDLARTHADNESVETLRDSFSPVLKFLEGTPARAIILTVVAGWSTILIIYLIYAQRKSRNATRDLSRNSRTKRVLLSLLTLASWIVAIVCAALLFVQYGIFTVTTGTGTKLAWSLTRELVEEALMYVLSQQSEVEHALNIVDTIITVGALAVVAFVASIICGLIEFVSCFVACCVSGKGKGQHAPAQMWDPSMAEKGSPSAGKLLHSSVQSPVPDMSVSPPQGWSSPQHAQSFSSPTVTVSMSPGPQQSWSPQPEYNQRQQQGVQYR